MCTKFYVKMSDYNNIKIEHIKSSHVHFHILMVLSMKMTAFSDVAPCGLIEVANDSEVRVWNSYRRQVQPCFWHFWFRLGFSVGLSWKHTEPLGSI
jgi:hypothetical protein